VEYVRLVPLTPELEARFWSLVKADYCDYYFFIYDLLLQKERTQIYLALEDDAVVGVMLIYDGHIVQLRGGHGAVAFMLNNLKLGSVDVQVPVDCEDLLLQKYPNFKILAHVTLMSLKKGGEQLALRVKPERLSTKDAPQIAQLMLECYPKMWSKISAEAVKALFLAKEAVWFGIKLDGKLVSFGYGMLTPKVCHVTWIATNPQYEKRGYATSIVSALVRECLAVADEAVIYVMDDNVVAWKIYSKVGFMPYKSYVFVKT
jgi:ribosomal protein S18 acetylase RimI-like enzyme